MEFLNWLWNGLSLIPMPLYDLHKQMRPTARRLAVSIRLNGASYFSRLLKVRLQSCRLLSSRGSSLLAAGSEAEGTCNLMLGETLPPLSTGTARINKNEKFHWTALSKSANTTLRKHPTTFKTLLKVCKYYQQNVQKVSKVTVLFVQ